MGFPKWMRGLGKVYNEYGSSIFIEVPLSRLEETMKKIKSHGVNVVNAISGYDSGKDIELLYHFVHAGLVLSVKTRIKRTAPSIHSVIGLFPSAMVFEQENHEMLGIDFRGNPSLKPLLLSDASPKFPLRKEVKNEKKVKT
jgi:NADH:ubiquinone oxidoreductase subunit C